jgi:hypothetical protein
VSPRRSHDAPSPFEVEADEETREWLARTIGAPDETGSPALAERRIRVRLDVPPAIKRALARVAADLGTSSSQIGAYLLAQALTRYLAEEPEVPVTRSASPRIQWNVDLTEVVARLASQLEASMGGDADGPRSA